jgi:hypothetical protein
MNKWLFALPCWLLAFSFTLPLRIEAMTIDQLAETCLSPASVLLDAKFTEVTTEEFKKRNIRVFAFTAPKPAGAYIAVDITNTDDQDAEIPRFEQICYQNLRRAPTMSPHGDITMFSPLGAAVPLRFRLNKTTTNKRPFNHTSWKTMNTVWMREVPCNTSPIVLNPGEWPPNGYPKPTVNNSAVEIEMRAQPPGKVCNQYALHLDLTTKDKSTTVDVGIDPQILNQPE